MRHCWELQQGDNSENVVGQDEDKEREEIWNKAHEFMADDVFGQIVSHEAIDAFTSKLQFGWNDGCFARRQDEED